MTTPNSPFYGPGDGWTDVIWSQPLDPASAALTGVALQAASDILWALTGRHLGTNTLTIRPCRRTCLDGSFPFDRWWNGVWPRPVFYDGVWTNLTCGRCTTGCSCSVVEECVLPSPVASVVRVKVDGAILDPGAYRVDDWRLLVRTDGGRWPVCNDLTRSDAVTGTWSVTVTFGQPVSTLGQMALGELAAQLAMLLANNEGCTLPKPVQQLVRQGVTMNFLDPTELFVDGRLGLYLCDLFIGVENPDRLRQGPQVYDLDAPGYRVTNT